MNLHEYQAKKLFARHGLPVGKGLLAVTPDEAAGVFTSLDAPLCVVKAQIHAGGRGKGGGVKLVRSADEAKSAAAGMLGKPLVTKQTGPEGRIVRKVWVETGCDIERELYLGVVIDREIGRPVLMASSEGGVEIEEVAERNPDAILKADYDPDAGLPAFEARRLAFGLKLQGAAFKSFCGFAVKLAKLAADEDCSLVEINPLVLTKAGEMLALDAKIGIDDRALARHPDLEKMRDPHEEDPAEAEAGKAGLSYVSMDGSIGCLVNGAGLAMATMDIIQHHGGRPANFLDVGGSATKEQVAVAFKLMTSNPDVRAVWINIFGGILLCDVLASGIVEALREINVTVPVVVRLEGTNNEEGRRILSESGLQITPVKDMDEGARKAVELAG